MKIKLIKTHLPIIIDGKVSFICHRLKNKPRLTIEICQNRGKKPKIFPYCTNCPKAIIRTSVKIKRVAVKCICQSESVYDPFCPVCRTQELE